MDLLAGKVAIITGAGRGIGRALAVKLAGHGVRVVINDADAEPAEETAMLVRDCGSDAVVCAADITGNAVPSRLVDAALTRFDGLDIIVNNAGFSWDEPIHRATDEQWDLVHAVNLKAPFRLLRAASSYFREVSASERREGREVFRKVVNVSSMTGTRGNAGQIAYAAAKAGVVGLTLALAKEWGRHKVNVNTVAFGPIATRQTETSDGNNRVTVAGVDVPMGVPEQGLEELVARIPIGRLGQPEEAAGAVYLLCTPESNYISGQVLEVSGGLSA